MSDSQANKILATVEAADFTGRARELDALRRHANGETKSVGLLLSHAPAVGASELLKQHYDRLFREHGSVIPFYFAVSEADKTAKDCAARFLQSFIAQTIAFRLGKPEILDISPDINELAELAAPDDAAWIDRLVAVYQDENHLNDDRFFVRSCLSVPLRAAVYGAHSFVMIDDLHETDFLSETIDFINELKEIFSRSSVSFVLAGRRRFLLSALREGTAAFTGAEILKIESLNLSDAGLLAKRSASKYALEINEQTRDLIARQFGGNPTFIKFLFEAANEKRIDLNDFQAVEQIYTDELFGGRIGKFYDSAFRKIAPNYETQKNLVKLLFEARQLKKEHPHFSSAEFQTAVGAELGAEANRLARLLNWHEIVGLSASRIETLSENETLNDYVEGRFRLESTDDARAPVVGEMFSDFLKRAPQLMAKYYRQNAAVGLREILSAFNCQELPANLLDYSFYKTENATEKIYLPQIIYTAQTSAFYPPFGQITETSRSAVALGFEERAYTDADETVWIAAEIDSKLEASKETTEFWCDRLEMVALNGNFLKYKLWLVAPEGFAPDALEVLRKRNAYGSSRRQAEQLKKILGDENSNAAKPAGDEYEFIVPMGEDTELIAANAVEEIARRQSFDAKAINQMKTALVEACINATEHSLSPDRKIHQKFTVEADKITITVSNRGIRLTDKKVEAIQSEEGRRGWGLKLMKTLMDEVKIEQVDDGTRISMVKYLKK